MAPYLNRCKELLAVLEADASVADKIPVLEEAIRTLEAALDARDGK
jgi:hypothetical protein